MDLFNSISEKFYSPDTAINSNIFDFNYVSGKAVNFAKSTYQTVDTASILHIVNIVFFVCAIFFIFIICYSAIRILELRKKEHNFLHHEIEEYAHHHAQKEKKEAEKNDSPQRARWGTILKHIASVNVVDWKLAIVDADSMLLDLLDQLGFKGDTLGDKLKSVDMEKYSSLKKAWDAHLIRNKIAHEGIQYEISEQEAKRTIAIYEQIFRDFKYI